MRSKVAVLVTLVLLTIPLSGCFGSEAKAPDESDVLEFEPTGRTVEIEMWVEDHVQTLWPGQMGNFWSFCAEAKEGSEDAVEYQAGGEPCSTPGPTIRVDQGDRVLVTFRNPHMFPHTIHWHGQFVPNVMDGVPGVTQDTTVHMANHTYDFIASRPGTLMYHCHVDTQHHIFMGLYGAFIVEPQLKAFEPKADQDYTMVLSHGNLAHHAASGGHDHGGMDSGDGMDHGDGGMDHGGHAGHSSGTPGKQNSPFEVDVDLFMINGQSFPQTLKDPNTLMTVDEGETVRIRLINVGYLAETMHLHGHDMLVTHKDGLPLREDARYFADTLRIDPGERYDVVVEANNPGKWVFHTHYPDHVTNAKAYPGGMLTQMVYTGYEDQKFIGELPATGTAMDGHDHGGMDMGHGNMTGDNHTMMMQPDPYRASFSGSASATGGSTSETFPVNHTNATVWVNLTITSGGTLADLTLEVLDPDGETLGTFQASSSAKSGGVKVTEIDKTGNYTAKVSGTGVDTDWDAEIDVVYGMVMKEMGG
ncbi:MAG: multicopper oxidase domain-containing protein [Euryarchaeota archaeon]|nr:multicopper oxidase domain-containing protein [Euryarchaeota archaeon]